MMGVHDTGTMPLRRKGTLVYILDQIPLPEGIMPNQLRLFVQCVMRLDVSFWAGSAMARMLCWC